MKQSRANFKIRGKAKELKQQTGQNRMKERAEETLKRVQSPLDLIDLDEGFRAFEMRQVETET